MGFVLGRCTQGCFLTLCVSAVHKNVYLVNNNFLSKKGGFYYEKERKQNKQRKNETF